jgi:drug/metabolite transporter (DMT)-like permease
VVFGLRRVDLWLSGVVVSWALSVVASKEIIDAGWPPLGYAALRFLLAGALLLPVCRSIDGERSTVSATLGSIVQTRRTRWLVLVSVTALLVNQVGLVYALEAGSASTVALVFGSAPVLVALIAVAAGTERVGSTFALAAASSVAGVAMIALAQGSGESGSIASVVLALLMTAGFATNSVVSMPLLRRYSPLTLCAVTFIGCGIVLMALAIPQLLDGGLDGVGAWAWFAFTVFSLVISNALFLNAAKEVGPSHAALFSNMQPFVAALFSVVLLSESLTPIELLGGFFVVAGVGIAWRARRSDPVEPVFEP